VALADRRLFRPALSDFAGRASKFAVFARQAIKRLDSTAIVLRANADLHRKPTTKSALLATLKRGTKADVLDRAGIGKWIHVKVAGKEDYFALSHGKPKDNRTLSVASIVADAYRRLTVKRPAVKTRQGRACGEFFALMKEIFDALGMSTSPETWARVAARRTGRRRLR